LIERNLFRAGIFCYKSNKTDIDIPKMGLIMKNYSEMKYFLILKNQRISIPAAIATFS